MTTVAVRPARRVSCCDEHDQYTAGCPACQGQGRTRRRDRYRQIAYGTWTPRIVPAEKARQHIHTLVATYGMSASQIAELSGTGRETVRRIADGRADAHVDTVRAILAVKPEPPRGGRKIEACGATRRLQALTALGYDAPDLAARLGVSNAWLHCYRRGGKTRISARRWRDVAALYELLSGTPGPSLSARTYARDRNWAPPLEWDGRIDDPTYQNTWTAAKVSQRMVQQAIAGAVEFKALTDRECRQVVNHLAAERRTDRQIAAHLRCPGGQVQLRKWRQGRHIPGGAYRAIRANPNGETNDHHNDR